MYIDTMKFLDDVQKNNREDKKMKNRNQFYMMDKKEAYSFIWECINSWCKTYAKSSSRIEDCVITLINNWNDNNVLDGHIDYWEYSDEKINNGYPIGLGIEDEKFIYPEFREEYEKVQEV